MAKRIGEVQELQTTLPNGFIGQFIRVRVKLDVEQKLTRFVSFTKAGKTEFFQVKYEKLPLFCRWDTGIRSVERGNMMRTSWSGALLYWLLEEAEVLAGVLASKATRIVVMLSTLLAGGVVALVEEMGTEVILNRAGGGMLPRICRTPTSRNRLPQQRGVLRWIRLQRRLAWLLLVLRINLL
jgi:hypothetical protein